MELEAHRRDRISWACSAQDNKLLPPMPTKDSKKIVGEKIKGMVSPLFDKYRKEREERKAKANESKVQRGE